MKIGSDHSVIAAFFFLPFKYIRPIIGCGNIFRMCVEFYSMKGIYCRADRMELKANRKK